MPAQDDTQPLEHGTGTVTHEPGSDDEAIALLNQRARSQAESAQETLTDEADDEADTGTDGGDPEEADEQAEKLAEVEYEGKTYSVPPELKDAVLRKADYSRRMQEVAAQGKDYAQRIEAAERMTESAGKLADGIAAVKLIDAKLKEFDGIDFDKLEESDPARASLLATKLIRLQRARDNAVSEANAINSQLAKERADALDAKRADMVKTLAKELPGWGDALGEKVSQYALRCGFTAPELQTFTDPRVVIALDKARKFDAIQEGRVAAVGKAKETTAPVLKPGQPRKVDKAGEAVQRFQRSKSPEDAVALLQARAAGRR